MLQAATGRALRTRRPGGRRWRAMRFVVSHPFRKEHKKDGARGGGASCSLYVRLSFVVYPHPYFGRKILVFLRLQTGLRCKILITKKFPAKYSWIRSYGPFRPLLAEWRREEGVPGRFAGKTSEDHCAPGGGNYLQGLAAQACALRAWESWNPGSRRDLPTGRSTSPDPQKRGTGGTLSMV